MEQASLPARPRGLPLQSIRSAGRFVIPGGVGAICLDLNGTIAQSEANYRQALHAAAQRLCGVAIPQQTWERVLTAWHMSDAAICRHAIRALRRLMPELAAAPLDTGELRREQSRILSEDGRYPPAPIEGITAIVKDASAAGVPLAVVTGSSADEGWRTLRQLGLAQAFSAVVSSLDLPIDGRKPHPLPYLAGLRRLGVDPTRSCCLALEDTVVGALAAHQAGLAVLVKIGARNPQAFAAELRARARARGLGRAGNGTITLVEGWKGGSYSG